MNTQNQPD